MRLPCFAALALGLPLAAMAAEVAGPNWELTDKRTLTVTFPTKPPVAIENDTAQVEDMIAHLGEYREAMVPEVPLPKDSQSMRYATQLGSLKTSQAGTLLSTSATRAMAGFIICCLARKERRWLAFYKLSR